MRMSGKRLLFGRGTDTLLFYEIAQPKDWGKGSSEVLVATRFLSQRIVSLRLSISSGMRIYDSRLLRALPAQIRARIPQ